MMMMEGGGNCCCKAKEVGGSKSKRCVFVFLRSVGSCFGWEEEGLTYTYVRTAKRGARKNSTSDPLYSIYCRSVTHTAFAAAAAVHAREAGGTLISRSRHYTLEMEACVVRVVCGVDGVCKFQFRERWAWQAQGRSASEAENPASRTMQQIQVKGPRKLASAPRKPIARPGRTQQSSRGEPKKAWKKAAAWRAFSCSFWPLMEFPSSVRMYVHRRGIVV